MDFWLTTSPLSHIFYNLPGGRVHHFNVRAPHRELSVSSTATVVTNPTMMASAHGNERLAILRYRSGARMRNTLSLPTGYLLAQISTGS